MGDASIASEPSAAAKEALWLAHTQSANLSSTGSYTKMEGEDEWSRSKDTIKRTAASRRGLPLRGQRRTLRKYASSGESGMSSGGEAKPDPRVRTGGRGHGDGNRVQARARGDGAMGEMEPPELDASADGSASMATSAATREQQLGSPSTAPSSSSSLVGGSVYRRRWAGDDRQSQRLRSSESVEGARGGREGDLALSSRIGALAQLPEEEGRFAGLPDPFAGSDMAGLRAELDRLRAKSTFLGGLREHEPGEMRQGTHDGGSPFRPAHSDAASAAAATSDDRPVVSVAQRMLDSAAARVQAGLRTSSTEHSGFPLSHNAIVPYDSRRLPTTPQESL